MRRPRVLIVAGLCLATTLTAPIATEGQDPASIALPSVGTEQIGTLAVGSLLTRAASFFDLAGTSLRFTPDGDGYRLAVLPPGFREDLGPELGDADIPDGPLSGRLRDQPMARSWTVDLPFDLPFAGSLWSSVWVNSTGTLSFGRPDAETSGERGGWADGTVRAAGAAIDVRSVVGEELVIAPLWSIYGSLPHENAIHVRTSADEIVVTWNTVRRKIPNAGYDPLGPNIFQVVATSSGEITFHYRQTPEKDGVVGIFPGGFDDIQILDRTRDPNGDAGREVDILSAEVSEAGTVLTFSLTLAAPVPDRLDDDDSASYRFTLLTGGADCTLGLRVDANGRSASTNCAGAPPRSAGYQVSGRRVDLLVSKVALDDPSDVTWRAEVTRSGSDEEAVSDEIGSAVGRRVEPGFPAPGGYDLGTEIAEAVTGNLFEVFNYPAISKSHARVSARIHDVHAAEDDMISVYTDFRIDDLYNHGPSTGTVNDPVEGIGRGGSGRDSAPFASSRLQVMHSPVYLGPRFSEHVADDDYEYGSYAFAVGWISHELLHRWSAFALIRRQDLDDPTALVDESCGCHWGGGLHNPSLSSVGAIYSRGGYTETSPMGGNVWVENEDGTFSREPKTYMPPSGASALDLYVMGLMPPEEVPETFVLVDQERVGDNRIEARKVPVRIQDIIAGSGVRNPPAHDAQREFRLGVYLLHEDGREPDSAFLRQSADIAAEMARYFRAATGGRMVVRIGRPTRLISD
jgi:hypothetical protein